MKDDSRYIRVMCNPIKQSDDYELNMQREERLLVLASPKGFSRDSFLSTPTACGGVLFIVERKEDGKYFFLILKKIFPYFPILIG